MDDGRGGVEKVELHPYDDAYLAHLRSCDHRGLLREAEGLYRRVAEQFGDLSYGGADRARAGRRTLGEVAGARLQALRSLAVGSPAPEIEGAGTPLRLSAYRGQVVVLVFWGTWCAPCMREVRHERALAGRLKGRRFALLGVDCDEDKEAARRVMARARMTWPQWHDGAPQEGPIARLYQVGPLPATFVIDPEGVIRYKDLRGDALDQAVEALLKEAEGKASGR